MNIFNTIFNLGVLFAVYGFIWFFIDLLMKFIISNRKQKTSEIYFSKAIKYIFLANVTFLFGLENNQINWQNLALSGLILLLYFIEKLQKNEKKAVLMNQFSGFTNLGKNTVFNRKAEIIVNDEEESDLFIWFSEATLKSQTELIINKRLKEMFDGSIPPNLGMNAMDIPYDEYDINTNALTIKFQAVSQNGTFTYNLLGYSEQDLLPEIFKVSEKYKKVKKL